MDEKLCPRSAFDPKLMLCWNQKNCQIKCNCNGTVCTKGGKCCDPKCIGGCDEDDPTKCKACKKFTVINGDNIICLDKCPADKYQVIKSSSFKCFYQNIFNLSLSISILIVGA